MKLRHLTISTLALILMTGCGDATGVEPDDLAGTWTASSVIFTEIAAPNATVDIVATESAAVSLVLRADSTYTLTITVPPEAADIESGTYEVLGTVLTLSQTGEGSPEPFTIARDGDTMTLTDTDEEFDFNDDQTETPATLVITLTRP